jgi:hypothetical protein
MSPARDTKESHMPTTALLRNAVLASFSVSETARAFGDDAPLHRDAAYNANFRF